MTQLIQMDFADFTAALEEKIAEVYARGVEDGKRSRRAPKLYTRKQAMQMLGVSENTLDRKVKDGDLPAVKINALTMFDERDIVDFINRNKTKARTRKPTTYCYTR